MTRPITDPGLLVEVPLWQERCDRDDLRRQAELDARCRHDNDPDDCYQCDAYVCLYCGEYEDGCDGECAECAIAEDVSQERRADR